MINYFAPAVSSFLTVCDKKFLLEMILFCLKFNWLSKPVYTAPATNLLDVGANLVVGEEALGTRELTGLTLLTGRRVEPVILS